MSIAWNTKISVSITGSPTKFIQCETLWGELKISNKIEMINKDEYTILKINDGYLKILSYDAGCDKLIFQPITTIIRTPINPGVLLKLSITPDYSISVTRCQSFYHFKEKLNPDKTNKVLFANESQNILNFKNPPRQKTESSVLSEIQILKHEIIDYNDSVYSFDVWNTKNYVANGLIVNS